jgi:hypothetical protein
MQNQIIPNLTAEQWEQCRVVLEEQSLRDAQKVLAQPPPQGIGIHMSVATLGRLKQRLALEDFFDQRQDTRLQTDALAQAEKAAHVQDATVEMLRQKAFQLALSHNPGRSTARLPHAARTGFGRARFGPS